MDVHIVQRGDTLWKISRQYGISFEELKRVNAHLANPDYIVPGMKIFLPDKAQGKGEVSKASPGKKVEKVERIQKTEKAPAEQPISLSEALQAPKEPAPIPAMPKPPKLTSKPVQEKKPAPPKQTKPEVEPPRPTPAPAPAPTDVAPQVAPPVPPAPTPPPMHQPMQPMVPAQPYPYPVIGIPCGWLPIYDADCYPFVHPGQMQPMPMPRSEPPMTQLPVPESSRFHQRPRVQDQSKKTELTKSKKDDKSHGLSYPTMPPKLNHSTLSVPEKMPMIESTSKPSPRPEMRPTPAPPEMPMQPEPMPYPDWSYQNNYPLHAGQSSPCGCSQSAPMPLPMPMPVQHHPFCNACNQPLGPHSNYMMPYPAPNYWHGMY